MQKGQAERLVPMLEEVLAEGGIGWRNLRRIAVGVGPGNFTGVRISVATARVGLALGVPVIGVTRLEALAHGLPRPLRVAEDARQGLAYVQDFPGGAARLERAQPFAGPATGSAAGAAAPCLRPADCRGHRPDRRRPCARRAARPLLPEGRRRRPAIGPAAGDAAVIPAELAALHRRSFRTPPPWSEGGFRHLHRRPAGLPAGRGRCGLPFGPCCGGRGGTADAGRRAGKPPPRPWRPAGGALPLSGAAARRGAGLP